MFEHKLLAAFLRDRKDYDTAANHVDRREMSPLALAVLEEVDEYYGNDSEATSVDLDLFKRQLKARFEAVPKHLEKANDFMEAVINTDLSAANVVSTILDQKRAKTGIHLADALLAQDRTRIQMYWQEYEELADKTALEQEVEDEYVGATLDQLEERFNDDGAWNLKPDELGSRIKGGLRPGHSVVLAARPERGKTLFGIQIAAGFLIQGAKVLYIGNEDPVPDLIIRMISNLSNMTEEQMFADKEKAMERAYLSGYKNAVFVGLSPGTLYEVEAVIRKYEPDVVIVDQMRNLRADTENNTQRLEVVARELRNMARRHRCVMVSMTQVGDSGRNKLVLDDGDIDGSNTGIPGACDVIIMIGSDETYEEQDLRMIKIAKNKRGGNHDNFTVSIKRDTSRVTSNWRDV
jgi:archaellum biogenesis ATPase FlaH